MADITITSLTQKDSQATFLRSRVLAETVTEGKAAYADPTSGQYRLADCETSSTTATVVGLFMSGGVATNYVDVITRGLIVVDATLVEDEEYFLSTSGLLMPKADIVTNDWITSVGFAKSTTELDVYIRVLNKQAA